MPAGDMPPTKRSRTQRAEPRTPASGQVHIEVAPGGELIVGYLLDVSPHGFAIRHAYHKFAPGQQVRVVYSWGTIPAWLVWVEQRDGGWAAGFRTG